MTKMMLIYNQFSVLNSKLYSMVEDQESKQIKLISIDKFVFPGLSNMIGEAIDEQEQTR